MYIISVTLLLCIHLSAQQQNAININNEKKDSYVKFPKWTDTTDGEGTLEFRFKTKKANGLLLYANGGFQHKNKYMFQVTLTSGVLNVQFNMGSDDALSSKNADLGSQWNDMEWHHVRIARNFREINIRIDNHEKVLTSDGDDDRLKLESDIFMGFHTDNYNEGFTGCIKDLKYPIGSSIIKSKIGEVGDIVDECLDTCSSRDNLKVTCQNGGECRKYFDDQILECDCTNTGYRGNKCQKKEIIGYLQKSQVISKSMVSLRSSRINVIQFRFRTNSASGIILYSGGQTEYILAELHDGNLILKIALGTDTLELKTGDGKLHDGVWHKTLIKRYGNRVLLQVDRFMAERNFKYYPLTTCSKENQKVYVGGRRYPQFIGKSSSKTNFEGCLQQVYFQDTSIEIIRKATIEKDKYTQVQDGSNIFQGCPVQHRAPIIVPTTAKATVPITTTTITTKTTTTKSATSPATPREPAKISSPNKSKKKLSETTVAWITGGICAGTVALLLTIICGFYYLRKRYSGNFSTPYKGVSTPIDTRGVYGIPPEYMGNESAPTPYYPNGVVKTPKPSVAL